jgi:transcriptional regulator with XRE-family HTH domain
LDYIFFGENLRLIREASGLTQDDLAEKVRKSQKAISKIENGGQRIYLDDLFNFADALNVSTAKLLTGQMALDDFDELIIAEVHKLDTVEARQALLKVIQVFCEFAQSPHTI